MHTCVRKISCAPSFKKYIIIFREIFGIKILVKFNVLILTMSASLFFFGYLSTSKRDLKGFINILTVRSPGYFGLVLISDNYINTDRRNISFYEDPARSFPPLCVYSKIQISLNIYEK